MLGVSCTGAAVYTVGLLGLMVMTPTYITCAALAMEPSTAVAMMFAVPWEAPAVTTPVEGSTEMTEGAELDQTSVGLRALRRRRIMRERGGRERGREKEGGGRERDDFFFLKMRYWFFV